MMKKTALALAISLNIGLAATLTASQVMAAGSYSFTEDSTPKPAPNTPLEQAAADNAAGLHFKALSSLERLKVENPTNPDIWNELGFAYRNIKDYEASAKAYTQALSLEPNHLGALNYQGFMYLETNQPDKAAANAAKLKALCGDCEDYTSLAAKL